MHTSRQKQLFILDLSMYLVKFQQQLMSISTKLLDRRLKKLAILMRVLALTTRQSVSIHLSSNNQQILPKGSMKRLKSEVMTSKMRLILSELVTKG